MLADSIRSHPNPHHPVATGILAPSVRTPPRAGYTPRQYVFFLPPHVLAIPGTQVRRWKLTIEFADFAAQSVDHATRDVDWTRPWICLGGTHLPVPAFGPRPHSHDYQTGTWYQIEIKFA